MQFIKKYGIIVGYSYVKYNSLFSVNTYVEFYYHSNIWININDKNICAGLLILCQSTFDFQKDFEYSNNKEFIEGVKNCALYYNALPTKIEYL